MAKIVVLYRRLWLHVGIHTVLALRLRKTSTRMPHEENDGLQGVPQGSVGA
jgi:hypothetical protein